MDMMTPQQIQNLMDSMGLRTTELAVRLGVTDDAVRKWLRGDHKPRGAANILLHQLRDSLATNGHAPRKKVAV